MKCAVLSAGILFSFIISTFASGDDSVLIGRFEMTSNPADPAYNDYLEAMGYSADLRHFLMTSPVTFEISKDDGKYTLKFTVGPKSQSRTIQPGEEFEDFLLDGRKCKSVNNIYDRKVVQASTCGSLSSIGVAEFTNEGMTYRRSAMEKNVIQVYRRV